MIILKMKRLQGLYLLLVLLISACSPDRFDLDNVVNSSFDWVDSEGARTVLRRASQMAMITWTPLRDVPRNGGVFEAGISVTGIPYSSTKQINKYLGFDVSYHTFMTAVHNPYSVLYTENIGKPPYGGVNCASFYGTVCSASVAYALDLDYPLVSSKFPETEDFEEIALSKLDDLRPCDVLFRPGHVFMIYKLDKDKGGSIDHVTIFEAASRIACLTRYSASDFIERIKTENLIALRYKKLDQVTEYEPSPYVAVGTESRQQVKYNEALCPNRGDRAVYRTDESVVVDVFESSYSSMIIEKSGDIVIQKDIIEPINDVGFLPPGEYEIYLSNGTVRSESSKIIVADPKLSVKVSDKVHLSFSCDQATPVYCVFTNSTGGNLFTYVFNETDIECGYVDLDALSGGPYYYKVVFMTPFGTVINKPVLADK